jgi:SNF2 family DNA or RNA helicase
MVTLRPIVITTYENMVADFDRFQNLFKRERIMLVFDEAHRIRTPGMRKVDRRGKIKWEGSHRTWCATELAWMSTRLYLLTGSPIVNGIKNAFSYINMLRPGQYYQSFHHFQVKHMVFSRDDSRLLLAYKDVNIVEEIIASLSIRHMKRDIHDLPEVTIRPRYLDWDPKQKKLYKDLQTTGVLEREGNFLEPKGAGAMLTRLHQILTNPRQLGFDCDSTRFTMLDDDLESIGLDEHKVVVFAHYRHTVRTLVEKYKHLNPAIIYGGTDDFEGEKLKFNEDPTCRLLIANPISAGIGINLTVSSYAIFFEYSYDLDMFDQAVSRLDRPGQKKAVTIIMYAIRGSMEDRKIIPRLISKKAFSTSLLRDPIEFLRFIDLDEFAEFQEAA